MGKYLTLTVLSCILMTSVTAENHRAKASWVKKGMRAEYIDEITQQDFGKSGEYQQAFFKKLGISTPRFNPDGTMMKSHEALLAQPDPKHILKANQ